MAGRPTTRRAVAASSCARPGTTRASEDRCARQILSTLARRAYRRPVTAADVEGSSISSTRAAPRVRSTRASTWRCAALLVDPEFLFRVERDPATIAPNAPYRVSDSSWRRGCRSSCGAAARTTSCSMSAARGRLKDPAVLERAGAADAGGSRGPKRWSTNFAGQWLYLRNVPSLIPNEKLYPDFDDSLRQAMRRETELFFESIVREDRSVHRLARRATTRFSTSGSPSTTAFATSTAATSAA